MKHYRHRLAVILTGIALAVSVLFGASPAHADPICNAPGLPPCAPPPPALLTPEQQCAVIAWRTLVPCNWWGNLAPQVPVGTPGSL